MSSHAEGTRYNRYKLTHMKQHTHTHTHCTHRCHLHSKKSGTKHGGEEIFGIEAYFFDFKCKECQSSHFTACRPQVASCACSLHHRYCTQLSVFSYILINLTAIQYNHAFSLLSWYNLNKDSILGSHGDPKHSLQRDLCSISHCHA